MAETDPLKQVEQPFHGVEILPPGAMPLTVQYAPRTLKMHTITEVELESVAGLSNSVHLGFLGISLGAFIAFAITLATVQITDPRTAAVFSGLTWLSGILSLYFGARSIIDIRAARTKLSDIKHGNL